ncbi:MAG: phosphoglycolate phosphatase [Ramlibacter sp.]|jgi:phosphoglycolate phosphatase|nr:phosphoglycolate phosphatase [Ramlibacter sp.]
MELLLRDRTVAVDAALFDLDGTLVHSLGDFAVALGALMDELDLPRLDAGDVAPLLGKGVDHLVHTVLARVVGEQQAAELFPRAKPIYWRHYVAVNGRHSEVYAGVREGLDRLRAGGVQLACVTNKPMAFARPLLQAMDLDGHFPVISAGDSHPRMKPDPLPLLATCERLGVAPARALMVGDSTNDSVAARAAGCPVALMRYGYNHGVPVDHVDCDAALDDLNELFGHSAGPASFPPQENRA